MYCMWYKTGRLTKQNIFGLFEIVIREFYRLHAKTKLYLFFIDLFIYPLNFCYYKMLLIQTQYFLYLFQIKCTKSLYFPTGLSLWNICRTVLCQRLPWFPGTFVVILLQNTVWLGHYISTTKHTNTATTYWNRTITL